MSSPTNDEMSGPPQKRKLEDIPLRHLPKELGILYPVVLDNLEHALRGDVPISSFQREFAQLYTIYCVEKDTQLRLPIAARAYVDMKAKNPRTPEEENVLKRLTAALKALPKEQVDDFIALAKKLSQQRPPPPPPPEPEGGFFAVDKEGDSANTENSKALLLRMQQCLKGTGEHAVPNYNEAISQAVNALASFPENPDILLQAALCYQTRAAREKNRPPEGRVEDMERARELLEEFLIVTRKPPYNHLPDYQKRREAVTERWHEIRQKLADQKSKEQRKPGKGSAAPPA
jgi:tetratricopeptide (TPR) repeat protein